MADAAAARREARRRRILENSQNRLQFISGKVTDEDTKESSNLSSYSEHEVPASTSTNSVFCLPPVNNGAIITDAESYDWLSAPHDTVAAGDTEIANDLAALLTSAPAPEIVQTKPLMEKIFAYKYDVLLLALVNQLVYSIYTFQTAYFFLPLIVYTVTKLIWFPTQTKSSIANAFLLLNGISATRVESIMNMSQWFSVISQDVCVYLFVTICIQSVLITLNNILT